MRDTILTIPPITWVDVARRLTAVTREGFGNDVSLAAPKEILATEVFWSGLTITLANDQSSALALDWLRCLFPSRVEESNGQTFLLLDAPNALSRLPITFEAAYLAIDAAPEIYRPSAALEGRHVFDVTMPSRPEVPLPVFAFHSVKGGVGRTTAAISTARYLARELLRRPVLLVDADFEAPGLSYLFASRKPDSSVSFEDMLVLAHADPQENLASTEQFVATRLAEQRVDDLFFMPVKRTASALSSFAIRPEHIVSARHGKPFLIVDILRNIAASIGCGAVVVDLRAGLVEIAMQVLSDPSVERVIVTTTSGQSIDATCDMLRALGDVQRVTKCAGRKPLMVVNQVPAFVMGDQRLRDDITKKIESAAVEAFQTTAQQADSEADDVEYGGDSPLTFAEMSHYGDLIRTSNDWDAFPAQLDSTGFSAAFVGKLGQWPAFYTMEHTKQAPTTPQTRDVSGPADRQEACRHLAIEAESMIVAEATPGRISNPLVTPPLRRLGENFLKQVPITVIEGAKGTGKTLTFRFLLEQENWRAAIGALDDRLRPEIIGPTIPVYGSSQGERMIQLIGERTAASAKRYGSIAPMEFSELKRRIQDGLVQSWTEAQWSDFWIDSIAWVSGIKVGEAGAWLDFLSRAKQLQDHPIALFEGLEEVIPDPYTDPKQAVALRALLVDVPLRLRQQAGRPVGIVVFVRGDMVEAVVRQNLAQFRAGYRNYALTWSTTDILELVVWLVSKSNAIPGLWKPGWREGYHESDLELVWGWKLGSERSREARSTEWVLAVLTDLNGRLTARDLVRFVSVAAKLSIDDSPPDKRLLAPGAMRRAVATTSEEKVKEYPSEVTVLKDIFEKLRSTSGIETPLDRQTALSSGLTETELANLVKYGVFFEEDGLYEVPELFRIGLGLVRKGARPNIISLTRRALEKARAVS